jgi:hypothetical protein
MRRVISNDEPGNHAYRDNGLPIIHRKAGNSPIIRGELERAETVLTMNITALAVHIFLNED